MSATNAPSRTNAPTPTFMGIPPELRLAIYDGVLVSDRPISLSTKTNHTEPPILRVSRQVRAEAIGTYYNQNTFHFEVCSWRGARMTTFLQTRAKYAGMHKQDVPTVSLCQGPCRNESVPLEHLDSWLRAVHALPRTFPHHLPIPPRVHGVPLGLQVREVIENAAIGGLHAVAALSYRPWEEVDALVDALKVNILTLEQDRGTVARVAQRLVVRFVLPRMLWLPPIWLGRAIIIIVWIFNGICVSLSLIKLVRSAAYRRGRDEALAWLLKPEMQPAYWVEALLIPITTFGLLWYLYRRWL